jgi:hypothetical protein
MVLKETGYKGMGWIQLAQDTVQMRIFYEQGNETSGSIKQGTLDQVSSKD